MCLHKVSTCLTNSSRGELKIIDLWKQKCKIPLKSTIKRPRRSFPSNKLQYFYFRLFKMIQKLRLGKKISTAQCVVEIQILVI